jgi:hypothetical protein
MSAKVSEEMLRFFIRNYAINSSSSFEHLIGDMALAPKTLRQAYRNFQCNYQFYVNRYMALSYIYYSLINAGSSYSSTAFLHENKVFSINKGKEESNFFRSANEPFAHQVIMQYAKLYEALVDGDALTNDDQNFNAKDIKHASKILDSNILRDKYKYLETLRKKIKSSGVLDLRNNIFAHPFKDGEVGSVVFLEYVSNKLLSIFEQLCDDRDISKYQKSDNRIHFFCSNYIMSANFDFKGVFRNEFRVKTTAQKHIKGIYDFMSVLRNEKLFGEEPLLQVKFDDAKSEFDNLIARITQAI